MCDQFAEREIPSVWTTKESPTKECPPLTEFEELEEFPQINQEDYADLVVTTRNFWNDSLTYKQRWVIERYKQGNFEEINSYFSQKSQEISVYNEKLEELYHLLMSIFTHPELPIVENQYVYRAIKKYPAITPLPSVLITNRPTSTTFSLIYALSLFSSDPKNMVCLQIKINSPLRCLCIGAFDTEEEWELLLPPRIKLIRVEEQPFEELGDSLSEYTGLKPTTKIWKYTLE